MDPCRTERAIPTQYRRAIRPHRLHGLYTFGIRLLMGINIAANLTLNTMASFVILLIACTARIACSDRHTYIHTDR